MIITGAAGMLGWDLVRTLSAKWGKGVVGLGRPDLDITSKKAVTSALNTLKPKVVINSAAYTNVDGAESEREAAFAINATGPALLAEACAERGIRLVHFSTDQVFDGMSQAPQSEEDPPRPANYYAETKLAGEKAVLQCPGSLVLRVQWLYGEKKDRFTLLRDKAVFTPFVDQLGAPTDTKAVAETVGRLLEAGASGLYHFAYDDFASWAEVYQFVRDTLGLSTRLEPRKTAEVKLPARRPLYSVLSNRKLVSALGVTGMGSWKVPLRSFLVERATPV